MRRQDYSDPEAAMSIVNHSHDFRWTAQRRSSNQTSAAKVVRPMGRAATRLKHTSVVLLSLTLLAAAFAGVVALRAAIFLHAFHY
jgi:hypothetical protein